MRLTDKKSKINGHKMRELADYLTSEIEGCGFALIAFDVDEGLKMGNYISNVQDEFMIKALEFQLNALKNRKTFPTPEVITP